MRKPTYEEPGSFAAMAILSVIGGVCAGYEIAQVFGFGAAAVGWCAIIGFFAGIVVSSHVTTQMAAKHAALEHYWQTKLEQRDTQWQQILQQHAPNIPHGTTPWAG